MRRMGAVSESGKRGRGFGLVWWERLAGAGYGGGVVMEGEGRTGFGFHRPGSRWKIVREFAAGEDSREMTASEHASCPFAVNR